jgi:hypothetical protein
VTNDPVLLAYAVRDRPGKKSIWTRIGAAWPHDRGAGLTVVLNLLPIQPRIILVEPSYDPPALSLQSIGPEQMPPHPVEPPDHPPIREANPPALVAYAVRDRPGKASIWNRIGAAWPHDKGAGLTIILNLMPIEPRIVLVEPSCDPPSPARRPK